MIDYDSQYHDPPAPMARVILAKPGSDARIENLPMLIDSGADSTLLPSRYVVQLGLEPIGDEGSEIEVYGGGRTSLPFVEAIITLGDFVFRGHYLVDPDREVGIIGRNLLNLVFLELHGPTLVWQMRK